jgi:molecular chaperone IbpA
MRNFDFTPLWRSTIGFERLFDLIDDSLGDPGGDHYPPYNIERTGENDYRISLALAGFKPEEITLTTAQNLLIVEGQKAGSEEHAYLHQGISEQSFKRQFNLADYVQVKNAAFENGLLQIELVRELPESMKPRRIAVRTAPRANKEIEHQKVA